MKSRFDIIISGAGMVGSTLACALGASGRKVAVIEPQAPERAPETPGLRVSALTLASQTVLEQLEVWPAVQAHAGRVEAMRVWEEAAVLNYDSAEIGEPSLAWIVDNYSLVAALARRMQAFNNISLLCPEQLTNVKFNDDEVAVTLASGRRLTARLLVGADGAASAVRAAAGIHWQRHDLGQSAIVAVVRTERPHGNTAYQRFLSTGPLALLPLADPHTVSIVWSADTVRADTLMQGDDAAFNGELQQAFGDSLGTLQVMSRRLAIPLALGFAGHYTAHRVALVGDAAHTVHPLAGQGVNLGILDAATLAETLAGVPDPGVRRPLRRYERTRKGADVGMQLVTGGFRYLFGSTFPGLPGLRRAGLELTERFSPLKHFFMRRASGLGGELPRLAQRVQR